MQPAQLNCLLVCVLFSTGTSLLVSRAVADEKAAAKTGISELQAGFAERDITPPEPFPMAGYFHERLSEGTADPLLARAAVFSDGRSQVALVVCDLIGVWTDFANVVRQRASEQTGIPTAAIVVSATHSHTAPDYAAVFAAWLAAQNPDTAAAFAGNPTPSADRLKYMELLVNNTVAAIVDAQKRAVPVRLYSGWTEQQTPVSFNRRFVQRDGSVRTWVGLEAEGSLRAAGPIDPEMPILTARTATGSTTGVLSSFALHLDTVGGTRWSADYPRFIHEAVHNALGDDTISIFGAGCCGDINHVAPRGKERNSTTVIGTSLGQTISNGLRELQPIENPVLEVRSAVVRLPLRAAGAAEVTQSLATLAKVQAGESVDFYDHVAAWRTMMIDQLRNSPRLVPTAQAGLARRTVVQLAGSGDALPVEIHTISFGRDFAIVCLPGEVFVELGLAIRRASPFRTTMVLELCNAVETYYVPTRAASAGGGYETTNSTIAPGGGEMLVQESIRLLQSAAGRTSAEK